MTETQQLLAVLSSSDDNERHRAAVRLGFLPLEPGVIEALKKTAREDPQAHIRHYAVLSLDKLGRQQDANEIRIEMLASTNDQTVREAVMELGKSADPRAADALLGLLARRPSKPLLGFVLNAVATLRDSRAVDTIAPYLADPEPFTRAIAAQSLGASGDARAVPLLRNLATDSAHAWNDDRGPGFTVGDIARQALARLGEPAPAKQSDRPWWKVW
ncbi:MAG: HEAT repeat domain-containing protein [Bryobacterales bacterium]|nr:HEAT repeat domain-containing protein [Bryobacterales bacterium]